MKLSIVSGLNESRSSQEDVITKFTSLCELLKPLKYDGIELAILEPEKIDVKKLNEVKDSFGLEISALGTGSTFIRFGLSFGHQDEFIRKKAIERIDKYIDFSVETQAKVIIGLIRGRYSYNNTPENEKLNIVSSLKECCKTAEDKGVDLVFEPINSFEIDSYNSISDSVALLEEVGANNLKLLVDTYHTNLEEDPNTIWDYLKTIAKDVAHIHLADSNRRAPGTGNFDFSKFISIFKQAGYPDFVSAETIMLPSFSDVAKQTSEVIRKLM